MPRNIGLLLSLLMLACTTSSLASEAQLIPEITALPFNCSLVNLDWYKKYDTKSIALSLVQRRRDYYKRWEKPSLKTAKPIDLNDVEVISFVPARHLESILKNGQLNTHQVPHSNSGTPPSLRAEAEDVLIGIHLDSQYQPKANAPVNYLRPKYGFVHFRKPQKFWVNPNRMMRYGDVMIVYNDQVKRRTTYTMGDSIDQVLGAVGIGKPHEEVRALEDFVPPTSVDPDMYYVEAQMWGALDLADVKEFRLPAGRSDLVEKLISSGRPVYEYDKEGLEVIDAPMEISSVSLSTGKLLAAPSNPM